MSLPVALRRRAQNEFDDAVDWYERQRPGRGVRFALAVQRVFDLIAATPEAFTAVFGEVREAAVARFPYAIYYRIDPTQITVIAVFHTARDPADWQSRA